MTSVPMDVDYIGKSKGERHELQQQQRQEQRERARIAIKGKSKINSKGKGKGKRSNDKECYVCGKRVISHETVGHEQTTTRW